MKKTMGQKIFELRKKNGKSQEVLSYDVGVSRQAVSLWENDTVQPTLENILALSKVFKVEYGYFLDDFAFADVIEKGKAETAKTIEIKEKKTKVELFQKISSLQDKRKKHKKTIIIVAILFAVSLIMLTVFSKLSANANYGSYNYINSCNILLTIFTIFTIVLVITESILLLLL